MWNRIRQIFSLPDFDGDDDLLSQAKLINIILIIILAGAILFPLFTWVGGDTIDSPVDIIVATLFLSIIVLSILQKRFERF